MANRSRYLYMPCMPHHLTDCHSQWQVCVLVQGLYQLEVTVFGYDNPTARCQGCGSLQGCCESFDSTSCGNDHCDSYFTYCLRTIGSTGRGCFYFGNRISDRNDNDGSLDFSQSMVLGLENPIILWGLTNTYMVGFFPRFHSRYSFSIDLLI